MEWDCVLSRACPIHDRVVGPISVIVTVSYVTPEQTELTIFRAVSFLTRGGIQKIGGLSRNRFLLEQTADNEIETYWRGYFKFPCFISLFYRLLFTLLDTFPSKGISGLGYFPDLEVRVTLSVVFWFLLPLYFHSYCIFISIVFPFLLYFYLHSYRILIFYRVLSIIIISRY